MFFFTPEAAAAMAAYMAGQETQTPIVRDPNEYICEICKTEITLDEVFTELEPSPYRRKFHLACLVVHLIQNEENLADELSAYISRKPVCTTVM